MTPTQFAEKYWSLDVFIVPPEAPKDSPDAPGQAPAMGSWQKTRIGTYRLGEANDGQYRKDFWSTVRKHIDEKGEAITVVVKNIWGTTEARTFVDKHALAYPAVVAFSGKGSPEEVQITLQLRYRFQQSKFGLNDFTKAAFIGLDCNGFVGNYVQRVFYGADWQRRKNTDPGPSSMIQTLMKYGTPMKSMEDLTVCPTDIFMLAIADKDTGKIIDHMNVDGKVVHGHIMITDPGTVRKLGDKLTMDVVESTGGDGLVSSQYRVESGKDGLFRVYRGVKGNFVTVRITRLERK